MNAQIIRTPAGKPVAKVAVAQVSQALDPKRMTANDQKDWTRAARIEAEGRRLYQAGNRSAAQSKFDDASDLRAQIAARIACRIECAQDALDRAEDEQLAPLRGEAMKVETVRGPDGGRTRRRRRVKPDGLASAILNPRVIDLLGEERRARVREAKNQVQRLGKLEAQRLVVAGMHYRAAMQNSVEELGSQFEGMGAGSGDLAWNVEARTGSAQAIKTRRMIEAAVESKAINPQELAIFKAVAGEGRNIANLAHGGQARAKAKAALLNALKTTAETLRLP